MFQVGIYARLSKEDGDNEFSESIDNQIDLIKKFIDNKESFLLIETYIDDGYSGLKFDNRIAFQKMIMDIKEGKINTVITKDMSRFGRESIETSTYVEKLFPMLGVRYISILDGYDSFTGQNIDVAPFKILLNDMYSKDISKKVRGSFEIKRQRGQFIGSTTPYGYVKCKEDHNKLIIDEYAASVVKRIFALYLEGNGKGAIATILEKEHILPPSVYKKEILKENYYNPHMKYKKVTWSFQTIHQILTNEVYVGNMVQKKYETISYKVKKKRIVPKEEQIIVAATHEAIIDRDTFETVQDLMKCRTKSLSTNQVEVNLFAGKLQCAECGHFFTKIYDSRKKEFIGYVCAQYKRHGNLYCTSHMLKEDEFEPFVLGVLKEEARKQITTFEINELSDYVIEKGNNGFNNLKMQINILVEKEKKLKNYKQKAFENYSDGMITKEEYIEYSNSYDIKINLNKKKIEEMQGKLENKKESEKQYAFWTEKFINYMNVDKLTREMVVELIDKIVVDKDRNVDIYFKFKESKIGS